MIRGKKDSEQGLILVIVLIVIAIITTLVVDLIYFTQLDAEISTNTKEDIQSRYLAKSGVSVVSGAMAKNTLEELTNISSLSSGADENSEGLWRINVPYFPIGRGSISLNVIDERSKINLNALLSENSNRVDQQVLTELRELFRLLEVDSGKSEQFIASLVNWMDKELKGSPNNQNPAGADGGFYASLDKPYPIKDGKLDTVGEIRLIDGMDEEFFDTIKDYVTVYPKDKRVNFSTAPKVVLMAAIIAAGVSAIEGTGTEDNEVEVSDSSAKQIAEEIIEARKDEQIINQKRARDIARDVDPNINISAGLIGVALNSGKSDVFYVKSIGSLGETNPTIRVVESVIRKTSSRNSPDISIILWKEL